MDWVGRSRRVVYVEKVTETFGKLSRLRGLYFGCSGCSRGKVFDQTELVRRWGTDWACFGLGEAPGVLELQGEAKAPASDLR
jgi:hypothetical protein